MGGEPGLDGVGDEDGGGAEEGQEIAFLADGEAGHDKDGNHDEQKDEDDGGKGEVFVGGGGGAGNGGAKLEDGEDEAGGEKRGPREHGWEEDEVGEQGVGGGGGFFAEDVAAPLAESVVAGEDEDEPGQGNEQAGDGGGDDGAGVSAERRGEMRACKPEEDREDDGRGDGLSEADGAFAEEGEADGDTGAEVAGPAMAMKKSFGEEEIGKADPESELDVGGGDADVANEAGGGATDDGGEDGEARRADDQGELVEKDQGEAGGENGWPANLPGEDLVSAITDGVIMAGEGVEGGLRDEGGGDPGGERRFDEAGLALESREEPVAGSADFEGSGDVEILAAVGEIG